MNNQLNNPTHFKPRWDTIDRNELGKQFDPSNAVYSWDNLVKQVKLQSKLQIQKHPATCLMVGFAIGGLAGWLLKRRG